jgi:hypothetical protein
MLYSERKAAMIGPHQELYIPPITNLPHKRQSAIPPPPKIRSWLVAAMKQNVYATVAVISTTHITGCQNISCYCCCRGLQHLPQQQVVCSTMNQASAGHIAADWQLLTM